MTTNIAGLRLLTSSGRKKRREQLRSWEEAERIRRSGLFDEKFYALSAQARAAGVDPVLHYLAFGEPDGVAPSQKFDPAYYRRCNPEVFTKPTSALLHYLRIGRKKRRRAVPEVSDFELPALIKKRQDTVILIIHEGTRTGAPILGWNMARRMSAYVDVVVVLMKGGPIEYAFYDAAAVVAKPPDNRTIHWDDLEAEILVQRLVSTYKPKFAILNSGVTRLFAHELAVNFIPAVALIHEFSSFFYPLGSIEPLYHWSFAAVFPARLVAESSLADYRILTKRRVVIVPQGPSEPPPPFVASAGEHITDPERGSDPRALTRALSSASVSERLRPKGTESAFLVVGIGPVDLRKGVDVFIATAAAARRMAPERSIRFVWIGPDYKSGTDAYRTFIREQMQRSDLNGCVDFIGEVVEDFDIVYESADLLYLCSRLDPMPNISIDASMRGLPVLCFERASGMAELLQADPDLRSLVLPYLDSHSAAAKICELSISTELPAALSHRIQKLAKATFDMNAYIERILDLGSEGAKGGDQQRADYEYLKANFPLPSEKNKNLSHPDRGLQLLQRYIIESSLFGFGGKPSWGVSIPRLLPGFNSLRYAAEYLPYANNATRDPLVHYLCAGLPPGPWKQQVIYPRHIARQTVAAVRAVIHGHFHYTELFPKFLKALSENMLPCDLFITTTSDEKADEIQAALDGYDDVHSKVSVGPNRGRDIGPFLLALSQGEFQSYDLVCHIHGKRSLHVEDAGIGIRWRNFLWQNLLGGKAAMADTIAVTFCENPDLGLVFPSDPHIIGWDQNREIAEGLAKRMGRSESLPDYFDFPVGTMFWARPQALAGFDKLKLQWDDFPSEPLPIDGTILHALERIIPVLVDQNGFRSAVTQVPGVSRRAFTG